MYYLTKFESPIGGLKLASDGEKIVGLWLAGGKRDEGDLPEKGVERDDIPVLGATKSWLKEYFAGGKPAPAELPLAPSGGEFQQEVWRFLLAIPYGAIIAYGAIAKAIAQKRGLARMSAQAVGGAVGRNPIGIIIPCHRVVGANGSLVGYGGGLKNKEWLLRREGVDMSRLFTPTKGSAL
jgi:methylated-DNA-[protein]-cysteine S-methyltransferase